jgi:hypothetical protein
MKFFLVPGGEPRAPDYKNCIVILKGFETESLLSALA